MTISKTKSSHVYKTNPIFIKEWDNNKNGCSIQDYSGPRKAKVWWKCHLGHSYDAQIYSREKGTGCPYCSGNKILTGYNDVVTLYPKIEQYYSIDNTLTLNTLPPNSKELTLWNCPVCKYTFECPVYSIVKSYTQGKKSLRCPVCSGRKAVPGINDFATLYPDFLQYWDYDKNTILPSETRPQSRYEAWWKCENNHSYQKMMMTFIQSNQKCPHCLTKKREKNKVKNHKRLHEYQLWYFDTDNIDEKYVSDKKHYQWKCPKKGHIFKKPLNYMDFTCPACRVENKSLQTMYPELSKEYSNNNELSPNQITYNSAKQVEWICQEGHSWKAAVYARVNNKTGCPHCSNAGSSQAERELVDFLHDYTQVETRNKYIIPPYEVDIYLPEYNIAIEYNGVYWHTESKGKNRNYHYDKFSLCQQKGIQLITVWEDDYTNNPEIIRSMLLHKIGKDKSLRLYARKTSIKELSYDQSSQFLDKHHIQGSRQGSFHIGLEYENKIVAVGVFSKYKDTLYLDRYATSCNVIGGAGKIMKYAIQYCKDNNIKEIVTYSDNCHSDGGLYKTLGFHKEKELKPDYAYLVNGQRIHKFNYRRKRFENDPNLKYDQSLSEYQLAILNGIEKIWDCGKIKWLYRIGE